MKEKKDRKELKVRIDDDLRVRFLGAVFVKQQATGQEVTHTGAFAEAITMWVQMVESKYGKATIQPPAAARRVVGKF